MPPLLAPAETSGGVATTLQIRLIAGSTRRSRHTDDYLLFFC